METYREDDRNIQRIYRLTAPVERIQTTRATLELASTAEFGLCLFIDNELQFASRDEYIYHEMLVHPAMLTAMNRSDICIIGGGDGLAAREVLRWQDVESVDLIDWDEELIRLFTTTYSDFNQQSLLHPRLRQDVSDIRQRLHEPRRYSVLIVDLIDPDHTDGECVNLWEDLLRGVKRWLAPTGTLVMNAGGFYPWDTATIRWLLQRISMIFRDLDGYSIQAYKVFVPSFAREWCYFLICPTEQLNQFSASPLPLPRNLRYFDANTWTLAHVWSKEFDGTLPTQAVNLNTFMPRL